MLMQGLRAAYRRLFATKETSLELSVRQLHYEESLAEGLNL